MWLPIAFANAATVSGPQTTTDGKSDDLSGLEWLTWDKTVSLPHVEIEAGTGNMFLADGGRYATRTEFEELFDSLWGGTDELIHASNLDGELWLTTTWILPPTSTKN